MNERKITRIDLETAPGQTGMIMLSQWFEGWQEGSACNLYDVKPGTIPAFLQQLEKQGFTVEMCDAMHGRALCGEITRMDFFQVGDDWQVRKYPYGWTARTHPTVTEDKPAAFDLEAALTWCEQHGWQVHRWPGGARAWKGQPLPVRDASAIRYLRRQVENHLYSGQTDSRRSFNLMFDF